MSDTLLVSPLSCLTHLAACHRTISILSIKYCWWRSHTTLAYSSIGLTNVVYAVALTDMVHFYIMFVSQSLILALLITS